ncbi:MAG TPA: ribonuclease III domain-containing protein [Holophagaceae bacterium]|nr:ribonuclease III domain-containing protein [Holophagaceae bacterium]
MAKPRDPARLEGRLGYSFRDRALLEEALTHASRHASGGGRDNQRLEFLGDALLNLCAAHLIHRDQPAWDEGPMSKLRGLLVCTDSLVAWAEDLGLELRHGAGRGRAPGAKPLADAVEALLAAVFLDAGGPEGGGLSAVLALVEARFSATIRSAELGMWEQRDAKTTLQERAAKAGLPAPAYTLVGQHGPAHAPRFTVRVRAGAREAEAEAGTRKGAETQAARTLLADWDAEHDGASPKP